MKKLQLLHDYLLASGLVTSESLTVWTTEGGVYGGNDAAADRKGLQMQFQVNIGIDDYPFTTEDVRKLFFALKWWLDVYEADAPDDEKRLAFEMDIKTSSTAYIWLGLTLTEDSWLQDGELHSCTEPLLEEEATLAATFLVYLRNAATDETRLIHDRSVPTD